MAEYELNSDFWYSHWGTEYRRGAVVEVPGDLDDSQKSYIQELVDSGTLVEPGYAEKLREEQAKADEEAEKLRIEQVERDDAEAARRVEAEQRRLHGDSKVSEDSSGQGKSDTAKGQRASRPSK